jgi:hypothetical protein
MMRVTYRSALGDERVEDMLGPTEWGKRDYRAAISRQRPGAVVLDMEPICRILQPAAAAAGREYRVTMRVPGRPLTRIFLAARSHREAVQQALAAAEAGAALVECRTDD